MAVQFNLLSRRSFTLKLSEKNKPFVTDFYIWNGPEKKKTMLIPQILHLMRRKCKQTIISIPYLRHYINSTHAKIEIEERVPLWHTTCRWYEIRFPLVSWWRWSGRLTVLPKVWERSWSLCRDAYLTRPSSLSVWLSHNATRLTNNTSERLRS